MLPRYRGSRVTILPSKTPDKSPLGCAQLRLPLRQSHHPRYLHHKRWVSERCPVHDLQSLISCIHLLRHRHQLPRHASKSRRAPVCTRAAPRRERDQRGPWKLRGRVRGPAAHIQGHRGQGGRRRSMCSPLRRCRDRISAGRALWRTCRGHQPLPTGLTEDKAERQSFHLSYRRIFALLTAAKLAFLNRVCRFQLGELQ